MSRFYQRHSKNVCFLVHITLTTLTVSLHWYTQNFLQEECAIGLAQMRLIGLPTVGMMN